MDAAESSDDQIRSEATARWIEVGRHLCCIFIPMRVGKKVSTAVISAFLVERDEGWCLATAGHVIQDLIASRNSGVEFGECKLVDGLSQEIRPSEDFIPFELDLDGFKFEFNEQRGVDYAFLCLRQYYKVLMQARGVQPFAVSTCNIKRIQEYYSLHLFGFPEQFVYEQSQKTLSWPMRLSLDFIEITPNRRFSGRVQTPRPFKLNGMSGGPVVGYDGQRYELVAIQSTALQPGHKEIFAVLASEIGLNATPL